MNAQTDDPETILRALWTEQGVPQERQDEVIAQITAKAQVGAWVGPFQIQEPRKFRSELTPAGEQLVISGCELDAAPTCKQLSLF